MTDLPPARNCVGIVGVGLIGGSGARAARKYAGSRRVIGFGRRPQRLRQAQQLGIVDEIAGDMEQLSAADLVIVCTPVDRIVDDISAVLQRTPPTTLVTDAGSVKAAVCHEIRKLGDLAKRFVGSHPLAGSHRSGFENADADLFVKRKCVVTPGQESSSDTLAEITSFWQLLKMDVRTMPPEEHDRVLALTSHLPHLAAAAVAGLIGRGEVEFAATGFADTTRVAGGDPDLWTAIFSENTADVVAATDLYIDLLQQYRQALAGDDQAALRALLAIAQKNRRAYDKLHDSDDNHGEHA